MKVQSTFLLNNMHDSFLSFQIDLILSIALYYRNVEKFNQTHINFLFKNYPYVYIISLKPLYPKLLFYDFQMSMYTLNFDVYCHDSSLTDLYFSFPPTKCFVLDNRDWFRENPNNQQNVQKKSKVFLSLCEWKEYGDGKLNKIKVLQTCHRSCPRRFGLKIRS